MLKMLSLEVGSASRQGRQHINCVSLPLSVDAMDHPSIHTWKRECPKIWDSMGKSSRCNHRAKREEVEYQSPGAD